MRELSQTEERERRRRNGCLRLGFCDRGRGFDPKALPQSAGFGLASLRERIELPGGRLRIRSARGRGSTFPIAAPNGQTPENTEEQTGSGQAPVPALCAQRRRAGVSRSPTPGREPNSRRTNPPAGPVHILKGAGALPNAVAVSAVDRTSAPTAERTATVTQDG
jgi:hypothetical protein